MIFSFVGLWVRNLGNGYVEVGLVAFAEILLLGFDIEHGTSKRK